MKLNQLFLMTVSLLVCVACAPREKELSVEERRAQLNAEIRKEREEREAKENKRLAPIQEEVKGNFYYSHLTEIEQKDYLRIVYAFRNFEEKIVLSGSYDKVFLAIYYDMPEFHWLNKDYEDLQDNSYVYPDKAKEVYKQLQQLGDDVVAQMPAGSEYDKVKFIYDYIIKQTHYNQPALEDKALSNKCQTIDSVLIDKLSVCAGYARTFQFLCQKAGIEAIYVAGDIVNTPDSAHAWNLVKIDGQYYAVDTTWGDPAFAVETGVQSSDSIEYAYLCMPKQIFNTTHSAWTGFYEPDGNEFVLPEISDHSLNYYEMNGSYFETFDRAQLEAYFTTKLADPAVTQVTMQLGTKEAYEEMVAVLESGFASPYFYAGSYHYTNDPYSFVIKVFP